MKRFARFWDLVYNSGNFKKSVVCLFSEGRVYDGFFAFSEWIYAQTQSTWKIALDRLAKLLYDYLTSELKIDKQKTKDMMIEDLMVISTRKLPKFLRYDETNNKKAKKINLFNKRQLKHSSY